MGATAHKLDFQFDHDISRGREFAVLESVLRTHAPKWSARMRTSLPPGRVVDVPVGGLHEAILDVALERSPELQRMLEASGSASVHSGSCEVNGATRALCVVPWFHERPMMRRDGGGLAFTNTIAVQIFGTRIEGAAVGSWMTAVFEELCARLEPTWAYGTSRTEFQAKLMDTSYGVARIGLDFSRYLPALFPLNFFGPAYVTLMGRDRLASIPCGRFVEYPHGIMIQAGPPDAGSSTAETVLCQEAILDHVGRHFFFSRDDPDRLTAAPDWNPDNDGW